MHLNSDAELLCDPDMTTASGGTNQKGAYSGKHDGSPTVLWTSIYMSGGGTRLNFLCAFPFLRQTPSRVFIFPNNGEMSAYFQAPSKLNIHPLLSIQGYRAAPAATPTPIPRYFPCI